MKKSHNSQRTIDILIVHLKIFNTSQICNTSFSRVHVYVERWPWFTLNQRFPQLVHEQVTVLYCCKLQSPLVRELEHKMSLITVVILQLAEFWMYKSGK